MRVKDDGHAEDSPPYFHWFDAQIVPRRECQNLIPHEGNRVKT